MQNGTQLAAIDIGSNSFRLEIGMVFDEHIRRTDYLKEAVRQGNGLDAERRLTPDAMARGLACLQRFGERLAGFNPGHVRAVATQTLREARNRDDFIDLGERALGFPIEVISGQEEARLIYQGVSRLLHQSDERRLVIDIGGRSTELILGQRHSSSQHESFRVGSVAWSTRFFPEGVIAPGAFESAELAAMSTLESGAHVYDKSRWDIAYGSSGTIGAVCDMLEAANWTKRVVTRDGLDWLVNQFKRAKHVNEVSLTGLKDDRRVVIAGGLSVLRAAFALLDIGAMHVASGALRHGVLFDLLSLEAASDLRTSSLAAFSKRLYVDEAQVERVKATACALAAQLAVQRGWTTVELARFNTQLSWAAQVHEIGHAISPVEGHRHGAYILKHAEVAGFSVGELQRLSLFVLGQRGKLRKLDIDTGDSELMAVLLCLRLAILLCHSRQAPKLHGVALQASSSGSRVEVSAEWSQSHPQSAYLLKEEAQAWSKIDHDLSLVIVGP